MPREPPRLRDHPRRQPGGALRAAQVLDDVRRVLRHRLRRLLVLQQHAGAPTALLLAVR